MNFPLARDTRAQVDWYRGVNTGRWIAYLPGEGREKYRIRLSWPADAEDSVCIAQPAWTSIFCVNYWQKRNARPEPQLNLRRLRNCCDDLAWIAAVATVHVFL